MGDDLPERNLDEMERLIRKAVAGHARLIVFHEATLVDYTSKLEEQAEPVPDGPACKRLGALARELNCYISFGLSERDGDRFHITQVFLGPEGFIHRYRKTWLWFNFADDFYRNEWARYDPGRGPELFTIAGIKAACMICADGMAERAITRMETLKPELVFYPNNRISLPGFAALGHLAARIGAPMLVTNRTGKTWEPDCNGGSIVYDADGDVLAEANRKGREEVLFHDLVVPSRTDKNVSEKPAPKSTGTRKGEAKIEWVYSTPADVHFARSETTVAQYRACVEEGACSVKNHRGKSERARCNWGHDDRGAHPINCVNWYGAKKFCEWANGRLPTREEWEAEASNEGTRKYPWGDEEATCDRCVMDDEGNGCGRGHTWPVCSKRRGDSVSGLCDISGNVDEWTSSQYHPNERQTADENSRVLCGGSWLYDNPIFLLPAISYFGDASYGYCGLGFRCVRPSK